MNQAPSDSDRPFDAPVIRSISLGPFQTNCYLVTGPDAQPGDGCWLVDCGMDPEPLFDEIDRLGLKPEVVVLTHAHLDHIAGLFECRKRYPGIPIWIHRAEEHWLTDPILNLSEPHGFPVTAPQADRLLEDGETLTLLGKPWRVLHTPGHSPGGITLVNDDGGIAIVGDTLFQGSIGRHDFPGSDLATLAESIRTKLYTLPAEMVALPGHGNPTLIGVEAESNPFVRADGIVS